MTQITVLLVTSTLIVSATMSLGDEPLTTSPEVIDIGSRRELFVDDYLIDELDGAQLTLGQPKDEGVVFRYDRPWEGKYSGYGVMLKLADDEYRYYYRGSPRIVNSSHGEGIEKQACVAFSKDGVVWERPNLGLHEVHGTKDNNVFLTEPTFTHNFAPFLDKPGTPKSERFKAVTGEMSSGVFVFSSEDGIHWNKMFEGRPVLQGEYLDAMNVAFWSEAERCYVYYARIWKGGWSGTRWIARSTSMDLEHWTPLKEVRIVHDGEDVPVEHYYHSGISPYCRAEHIYVSLCSQITDGRVLSPEQVATLKIDNPGRANSRSGGGLMSSRGGYTIQRTFMEEFIRPQIGPENWIARCNYPVVGMLQTGEAELSIYVNVYTGQPSSAVRRYTLRVDGLSSLKASYAGGEMVTKPFMFDGNKLSINYATSSRGHIKFQFETPNGEPIDRFSFEKCHTIVGNEIERFVVFSDSDDLGSLSAEPVRLRVKMKDADLYSLNFCE